MRLRPADVRRFQRRLSKLAADLQQAEDAEGETHALAYAFYRPGSALPAPEDDGA